MAERIKYISFITFSFILVGFMYPVTGHLGPRFGKHDENGNIKPVPGHNLSLATIGCFILWLGWFGFNPGSTMAVARSS